MSPEETLDINIIPVCFHLFCCPVAGKIRVKCSIKCNSLQAEVPQIVVDPVHRFATDCFVWPQGQWCSVLPSSPSAVCKKTLSPEAFISSVPSLFVSLTYNYAPKAI